jgi:flagellar hook-length control protein FliK
MTTAAGSIGTAAAPQAAADPAVEVDVAIVTAAVTPGATTAKTTTGLKTPQPIQGKAATAGAGTTTGTTVSSASATTAASNTNGANAPPQPGADPKPDQANTLGGAIKADANASAPSTAAPAAHDPAAAAANAQAPAAVNDPNAQLAALPQQISPTATANPSDKLTVTQATGAAVPLSGLAVEIAASAQSGKTHFDVRLDPADLGRIDVRIAVDRNGQVTSHLTVEKPETLSMLQQDAPQLQQALNDAGLKTGSGGLQFSLRDQSSQSGQNNFNQSGGQPQRLVISEDDTAPAVVAGRSYGRLLAANGGVDIRV